MPKNTVIPPFYVLVDVKLDPNNTWNEWLSMGGFSFQMHTGASAEDAARHARHIVDRKGVDKVRVSVLDPETKLYADPIEFEPIKF
ncbi:hypothetical protein ACFZCP_14390 [Streptomyces sp. NPDC007971]|uniref:hypothetical protein n=1 Tax=Streptomyces sp. NPDC007971 TaxID=3364799 RepID=UPI0036EBA9ED